MPDSIKQLPLQLNGTVIYYENELLVVESEKGLSLICNMNFQYCTFHVSGNFEPEGCAYIDATWAVVPMSSWLRLPNVKHCFDCVNKHFTRALRKCVVINNYKIVSPTVFEFKHNRKSFACNWTLIANPIPIVLNQMKPIAFQITNRYWCSKFYVHYIRNMKTSSIRCSYCNFSNFYGIR